MADQATIRLQQVTEVLEAEDAVPSKPVTSRRKKGLLVGGAVVALALVGAATYGWAAAGETVSTDNAYVNADVAQINAQVAAPVTAVRVIDTQEVKAGDVLVVLDQSEARIAIAEAEAQLGRAIRGVEQTVASSSALSAQVLARGADISRAQAMISDARANLARARIDLQRRESLAQDGAVSGEELSTARNAFASAQASVRAAEAGLAQASSTRSSAQGELAANNALVGQGSVGTNPEVLAAKARLDQAQLNFERTIIRAPIAGVVAQRSAQIGQRVQPGARLMTIVPMNQVFVDANFKEGQLRGVAIGQPVRLTADLYGSDVTYRGRVVGLGGGTGTAFSLMPAQNATGNWIKVTQRLPVRIAVDARDLRRHPLRVGLSMEAEIDLASTPSTIASR